MTIDQGCAPIYPKSNISLAQHVQLPQVRWLQCIGTRKTTDFSQNPQLLIKAT
eukprot:c18323_g1_i1 orf=287-445(+)